MVPFASLGFDRMAVTLFIPCFMDALTTVRFRNLANTG
jgi:hypothetical protein